MSSPRGEYRSIYVALWNGPDWQTLTPTARLVWLAVKGNAGPCGIAAIPGLDHAIAEWTGLDTAAVSQALAQLEHGRVPWIKRERNVVCVVGGLANEPSRSHTDRKHRQAAAQYVASLPRLPLVGAFVREHPEWFPPEDAARTGLGWALEGPSNPLRSTETETETETETDIPARHAPEPTTPPRGGKRPSEPEPAGVAEVVAHYTTVHPRRSVSPKARKLVGRLLTREGWGVADCVAAIDGNAGDPWHAEKRKHELEYVLRDDKRDGFRELGEKGHAPLFTGPELIGGWMSPELERLTRPHAA